MGWVRLWEDMPTDPKWRAIAYESGRSVSEVIAVFIFMMVRASAPERNDNETPRNTRNAVKRGILVSWRDYDVAAALDLNEEDVSAIFQAMQGKVIDGENRLLGWEKRQPLREDTTSSERVRAFRERLKRGMQHNETQGNAPDTDTDKKRSARAREAPSEVAPTLASRKKWPNGRMNGHDKSGYAPTEDALMTTKFTPAELERHNITHKIYVKRETAAGDAWAEWTQKNTGHSQVWDAKGGWYFPSELPPQSPSEN